MYDDQPTSLASKDDDLLDEVLKEIAAALLHADVNVRYVSELRTVSPSSGGGEPQRSVGHQLTKDKVEATWWWKNHLLKNSTL